jgi:hypothetical protein
MNSERKSHASRENGKKSRGPKTPEGKANSARNATRHGLLARNLLLDRESAARFHEMVIGLHDEFQPETPAEVAAVESMAWSRWRQMRLWTLEQAAINAEIQKLRHVPLPAQLRNDTGTDPAVDARGDEACARASQAFTALGDRSNALNLFNRCETAYDRQFSRAFRRLLAIREARQKNENGKRTRHVIENKPSGPESEPNLNPMQPRSEPNRT